MFKKRSVQYFIVIIIFIVAYFSDKNRIQQIDKFKKQNHITTGVIVEYFNIGGGSSTKTKIRFIYNVNGIEYKNSTTQGFLDCGNCKGNKYKVFYNKDNPKEAYIDLKHEVK